MAEPNPRLAAALADRYRLEREIGAGGMAVVYVAEDLRHRRRVAIKVLRPELAATLGSERFLREIEIAARLQHPHVLPVHDSGEAAGFLYYVMPYVEGETLRERLRREPQPPLSDTLRILREVTDAIAYAHAQGVMHRDIKPENILLSGRHALVADFGVAKAVSDAADAGNLTTAGVALGTPQYMSPEQATADPGTDHRADLYALGAVGYEMLAGRAPFIAATAPLVLAAHIAETPVPVSDRRPGVPAELADVIMRCLAKAPADRPPSGDAVLAVLETLTTPSGGTTPAATRPLQAATPIAPSAPAAAPRRTPRALVMGVVAALLAVGAVGLALRTRGTAGGDAAAERPRIVVLPPRFVGAPEREYVAEGIADEINNRLVSLPSLDVVGRASADRFRSSDKSLKDIGAALGAPYILALRVVDEGAGGPTTRVTAELLRAATESQAWSGSFTVKSADDMFALQREVAERAAGVMGLRLSGDQRSQLASRPTRSADAYDAYLRARDVYHRGAGADDYVRSAALYETATRLDSSFAAAWAGAGVANLMVYWYYVDRTAERLARARAQVERARALAPDEPSTHFATGDLHYRGAFDLEKAEGELRLAADGDPGNPDYRAELAYVLRREGRFDEARQALERAVAIDPLNTNTLASLGQTQFLLGDVAGAEATMRRVLSFAPYWMAYLQLIDVALERGDPEAARREAHAMFTEIGVDGLLKSFPNAIAVGAGVLDASEWPAVADQVRPTPTTVDTLQVLSIQARLRRWSGRDVRTDYAALLPRMQERVKRLPEEPAGWIALGFCLLEVGRSGEAIAAARRALDTPQGRLDRYEGPAFRTSAAVIAARAGDQALAVEWAKGATANILGRVRLRSYENPDMAALRAIPAVQDLLK